MIKGKIWEEPDHKIDKADIYGSGKMYDRGGIFQIEYYPQEALSTIFMIDKELFNWAKKNIQEYENIGGSYRRWGSMYLKNGKLAWIAKSLLEGNGIRKTSRIVHVSKNTVKKFYKILLVIRLHRGDGDILCKCGKPSVHMGWCHYKFLQSQKRQKFIKNWKIRNI